MKKYFAQFAETILLLAMIALTAVYIDKNTGAFKQKVVEKIIVTPTEALPAPEDFPDFGTGGPIENATDTKQVVLYHDFSFTSPIVYTNIINQSRLVRAIGKVESAFLIVKARATELSKDPTRCHTVYFYIDTGKTGGHIDAVKQDNRITSGCYYNGEVLDKKIDLTKLELSTEPSGQQTVNVLKPLQDGERHFVGAFVATGGYGVLDELSIEYSCYPDTVCEIQVTNP